MADQDGLEALDALDGGGRMVAEFGDELARLREAMSFTTREVGTLASGIEGGLRRAFSGLALAIVRAGRAGAITLRAEAEGLQPAHLHVQGLRR